MPRTLHTSHVIHTKVVLSHVTDEKLRHRGVSNFLKVTELAGWGLRTWILAAWLWQ